MALVWNCCTDETVEFSYTNTGKPFLSDYSNIYFNLSHSKNVVACAVANREVGVDIQNILPISEKVAKKVLTSSEYTEYRNSLQPDEYFCKIWTIKESNLKKTGKGITIELNGLSADSINDKMIYKINNYVCCVCGPELEVKYLRREDIEQLRHR